MVLGVPMGHGPPALSPRSGSEVRVLLFNATGDRDTAALLKLLLVRFWGGRFVGGESLRLDAWVICLCWDRLCWGAGSRKVELMSVCLSVHPAVPGCTPPRCPPQGSHSPGCRGRLGSLPPWTKPPRNPAGVGLVLLEIP